jgi:hypothetical protein
MASVGQRHLLDVLRGKAAEVATENSIPKYERELITVLAEILSLERSNLVAPTHIQKKVSDKVEALAVIIEDSTWGLEEVN